MKSCSYIQEALYIRPTEVRACCQRFFYKGKLKGDVVLYKFSKTDTLNYDNVLFYKQKLLERLNTEEESPCTGCDLLEDKDWLPIEKESLSHISIEHHSVCNMKCIYCSPEYYGGKKPPFKFTEQTFKNFRISNYLQVSWGGGEPTILPSFQAEFKTLLEFLKPQIQKVYSNSLRYSRFLQEQINIGNCNLTTSIDAGTENTFKTIRGTSGLHKVLNNLNLYSKQRPECVTIKYIATKYNISINEIEDFISNCKQFSLLNCSFLISTNYKNCQIDCKLGVSLLYLYYKLKNVGAVSVTIDNHVYSKPTIDHIQHFLYLHKSVLTAKQCEILSLLGSNRSNDKVNLTIWGTGEFAKSIVRNLCLKSCTRYNVNNFVDSNRLKHGDTFLGHKIKDPQILSYNDDLIVVASSNFYRQILIRLEELNIDKDRIVPNFLI